MYKIANKKYPGVTSLLFVLVIGLVLVVMVAGIATLTIREQQQASNTELSNRALQTAELGIKKAVQKLVENPEYTKTDCDPSAYNTADLTALNQKLTCITVNNVFKNYESYLQKDRVERLLMGPSIAGASVSPTSISVKWNNPSLGDVSSGFNYPDASGLYPVVNGYNYAATIELTFVYWPTTNVTPNNISIKKFLLAPGNNTNPADGYVGSLCEGQGGAPSLTDYKCSVVAKGSTSTGLINVGSALGGINTAAYNIAIIIGSRYKGTHIQAIAYDTDNQTQLSMRSANAQIDSTAQAGNLYRRVKASRSTGLSGALENVLDGPIFSGMGPNDSTNRNICKNFTAIEDPAGSGSYKWSGSGTSPNCNNISL